MGLWITLAGVALATGGTVWSLWDIIAKTDGELYKEAAQRFSVGKKVRTAKQQRNRTIWGLACICGGAALQGAGLFFL